MRIIKIITLLTYLFMTACNAKTVSPEIEIVPPAEFKSRLEKDTNAYLLDVRRPDEFAAGHLKGAHFLNWLDEKTFKKDAVNLDKSKTIYLYCRSGRRSNEAAVYLADKGYKVVDMDGGILAWTENKFPIVADNPDVVDTFKDDNDIE